MTVDNPKGVDEEAISPKHSNEGDRTGLTFTPYFTTSGVHPYDLLETFTLSIQLFLGTPRCRHLQ